MTNVLFITTLFDVINSSAAIRNNSLVKGMIENGCNIDIYTVKWPEEMQSRFFQKEGNGNIYYTEIPSISINNKLKNSIKPSGEIFSIIKKTIKNIIFFPDICYRWNKIISIKNLESYDLIITSSDFKSSHFVGKTIRKKYPAIPWIQIWGDPWSTDINTPFFLKPLIKLKETKLFKISDKIIFVSEPTANEMKKKHPDIKDKIAFIPRSYYFRVEKTKNVDNSLPIHIVYTGVIGLGRNIDEIIEAIIKYNQRNESPKIILDFYSNINLNYEKYCKCKYINFFGLLDFENMKSIYENADILLYISNGYRTTQIPGKFFDYLGTNLPILCLVNNKEDQIFSFISRHQQCLAVCNDRNSIYYQLNNIESLINKPITIDERYSPKFVAKQLLNSINVD